MSRKRLSPLPELDIKHVYYLIRGVDWHFDRIPAFPDEQTALAAYRTIRPFLLDWCQEHLHGGIPWIEGQYLGRAVPRITTADHGFMYESVRQCLAAYHKRP